MSQTVSLPFSSQQQLLARLRHLSRLETDFILLTGPKGAGKSHLAHQLLEQTSLSYPVLLDAKALDSHEKFREALLSQWFAGAIFDAQDSLTISMTRLLAKSLHKRLLIVDNGAWLTDIQLQELVELYATLPAAIRPFMVLLGTPEWAQQVRAQIDELSPSQVLEVEVPPLTASDLEQLWHALKFQPP
ncbi:ATP-binding protein [Oceanisphaera avium]|uniref:ATP-binding protein n=1 Tax=Oceanisphaera avium TaxID=1903694 RepID=UPI001E640D15|nr:ATP-binding protein [Oceanisphaera avium]